MRKLSNTIYTTTKDTFTCEGLPDECTVITPNKEFKVKRGNVAEREFKPVTTMLELYENIKHTLMNTKRKIFDFYECDEIVYPDTYPNHDDIVINLNDFSFRIKNTGKELLNLDELGAMSDAELDNLDCILREGIFRTTYEIYNEESDRFETIGDITVAKTNELIDEIKDYLYSLDDEVNLFVSRFDDYSEGMPLKHLGTDHNGDRPYILKRKRMLKDILYDCKENAECAHMINMLFTIIKGLPKDTDNFAYDNVLIIRCGDATEVRILNKPVADGNIKGSTALFDNHYINIRYVIKTLSEHVYYESVLNMYVIYKMTVK